MSSVGKIQTHGFYIVSSIFLAIALVAAVGRTIIRLSRFRQLYVDDFPFFLALVCLIAGTGLLDANVPDAYQQELIEAGVAAPPADFIDILLRDQRVQYAATILIGATITSIKFSFLLFFYRLIRRTKRRYTIWWYICLVVTIGTIPVAMFSNFIACPHLGPELLTECVTPHALTRENATLQATIAMDIISDVFIISMPIMILWNLQMSIRRKLILAGSLCLGVFMIVCAVVRVSTSNLPNGQVDTLWILMWTQMEACVAVIVASSTAFATLFTSGTEPAADMVPGIPTRREWYEIKSWVPGLVRSRKQSAVSGPEMAESQANSSVSRGLALIESGDERAVQNYIARH